MKFYRVTIEVGTNEEFHPDDLAEIFHDALADSSTVLNGAGLVTSEVIAVDQRKWYRE